MMCVSPSVVCDRLITNGQDQAILTYRAWRENDGEGQAFFSPSRGGLSPASSIVMMCVSPSVVCDRLITNGSGAGAPELQTLARENDGEGQGFPFFTVARGPVPREFSVDRSMARDRPSPYGNREATLQTVARGPVPRERWITRTMTGRRSMKHPR